jgi:hypothetical protein
MVICRHSRQFQAIRNIVRETISAMRQSLFLPANACSRRCVPSLALPLQLHSQQTLRKPAHCLRPLNAHKLSHSSSIKASSSSIKEPSTSPVARIAKPAASMVAALALLASPMTVPAGPAYAAGELASAPGSSSNNSGSSSRAALLTAAAAAAAPSISTLNLAQGGWASFSQHSQQPVSQQLVSDPQSSSNPGWAPPSPMPHPPASPPQSPSPSPNPGTPSQPSLPPGPPQLLPRKPPVPDSSTPAPEVPRVPDVPPQLLPPCPANPQPPQLLSPCPQPRVPSDLCHQTYQTSTHQTHQRGRPVAAARGRAGLGSHWLAAGGQIGSNSCSWGVVHSCSKQDNAAAHRVSCLYMG